MMPGLILKLLLGSDLTDSRDRSYYVVIRSIVFEFHWNDQSEAHIARHKVTPAEVEEAARKPYYIARGDDDKTLLFGQTYAGRYLLVVMSEAMDGRRFVVTARDMEEPERKAYERRKGR
ncbi:hypothetical protein ACWDXV_33905 [Nocardia nova]